MEKIPFCLFTPPKKGKKIVWKITSQCNMQCKHCCSNASNSQIASLNEFIFLNRELLERRINEMISFGIKEFYISGGEPFLAENTLEFLELLKKKGVKISVASNGYCLRENTIKRLSEIKIDLLHISLDGHLSKIHNALRGGNFFDRTVKNIKMIKRYKVPLRIGCIIWRKNEDYLDKMVKLCVRLKVEELRFSWLVRVGRFKDNPQLYPKRDWLTIMEEIKDLRKKCQNKIKITVHRISESKYSFFQICPAGDKLFFLNHQGKLSPCSWIAKIDPNFLTKDSLREKGIKNLAGSKEFLKFRKIIEKRCNKNFKGCPFAAKYQNGSYYSNDNLLK